MRPSQVLNLTNDYEAFCFDEACAFIISEMSGEDKKKPDFKEENNSTNNDNIIKFFKENN